MAIADLLMSQRRWGQTRCRKFLAQVPMSEKKTIGSMTDRQRRRSPRCSPRRGAGPRVERDPLGNGQPEESVSCHQPGEHADQAEPRTHLPDPAAAFPRSRTGRRANL